MFARQRCTMAGKVGQQLARRGPGNADEWWLGESQFLTTPALAKPLNFGNLSLNDDEYEHDLGKTPKDSDARLMEMLAAQANHLSGPDLEDEQAILDNEKLSESEKKEMLQRALHMAASNGDVERVGRLLDGEAKNFIDLNASDEDGTPPLIYASCFVRHMSAARTNNLLTGARVTRAW